MERTKIVETEDQLKPRWKKLGGGSLRIGNRIIKPGQIFRANPEEIAKGFRNMVMPLDKEGVEWKEKENPQQNPSPIEGKKPEFKLQPHGKSLYLFDIIDDKGKVINEKSLKKEVAEQLIIELQK